MVISAALSRMHCANAEKQHIILGTIWLPLFHTADCQISIQSVCSPEEDASLVRARNSVSELELLFLLWWCCASKLSVCIQHTICSVECHMNLQYRFSLALSAKFLDDVTPKINLFMIINVPVYFVLTALAEHGYDHWVDLLTALYTLSLYTPLLVAVTMGLCGILVVW